MDRGDGGGDGVPGPAGGHDACRTGGLVVCQPQRLGSESLACRGPHPAVSSSSPPCAAPAHGGTPGRQGWASPGQGGSLGRLRTGAREFLTEHREQTAQHFAPQGPMVGSTGHALELAGTPWDSAAVPRAFTVTPAPQPTREKDSLVLRQVPAHARPAASPQQPGAEASARPSRDRHETKRGV